MIQPSFADVEGDGFLENLSRLWTIQFAPDADSPVEVYSDYADVDGPLEEGLEKLSLASHLVFHNGLKYDFWAVNKLFPGTLNREQIIDSLVISRMMDPESKRHNLAELGEALGYSKIKHEWDFSEFHPDMVPYGIRDVQILQKAWKGTDKVYSFGKFHETFQKALRAEFRVQYVIAKQEQHGFRLDVTKALELESELRSEKLIIERELQKTFPPIVTPRYSAKQVDKITGEPKRLKDEVEVFNINSRDQIADRLIERYGWQPKLKTETGKTKVDEAVLSTLDYPEAKTIARSMRLTKQLGMLSDGDNAWLKLVTPEGYIHGGVNTIGCRTHRMTHFKPNMAQVDKDPKMRALFGPDVGHVQVGVDAEGLELRMLAHYLAKYDGGKYAEVVHSGDKTKGTDVHNVNKLAAGLQLRDSAKTMIYALLYGAGDYKLGTIYIDDLKDAGKSIPKGSPARFGKQLRANLEDNIKGFRELTETCKKFHAKRKVMPGLDGRWIPSSSDHSALNTLLQGNGAIVMKYALCIFDESTLDFQSKGQMYFTHNVHDEVGCSTHPSISEQVASLGKHSIKEAGEVLGVRCPLVGDAKIGSNWYETH